MKFDSLKEKCEYYRSLTDYRLLPNSYVIVMLDGKNFSRLIKNKYKKPFDETFVNMMNETAKYVCKNVQGCKFAYTQSDEISLLITDFDTPNTDSYFGFRLCKIQSILAALATAKFNQLVSLNYASCPASSQDIHDMIEQQELVQFDCKAWTVPNLNDAYAHFLWRQLDCLRNSKQQAAQTYLPHKRLMNLHVDAQVDLLKAEKGIDWNEYEDGVKYGRFIATITEELVNDKGEVYFRKRFKAKDAYLLNSENGFDKFVEDIKIG